MKLILGLKKKKKGYTKTQIVLLTIAWPQVWKNIMIS